MRILLTGASGFVGRAVLRALLSRDVETIAVSRRRPAVDGEFQWHSLDIFDHSAVSNILEATRPDAVLHLAWTVEHGKFWTTPSNLDWVAATLSLARGAADAGVKRFVGTGTCYEYEWPSIGDCREDQTPIHPSLLYGTSKDAIRRVLEEFARTNAMGFVWARLFFLYGPGEAPGRLVPSVAQALAKGEPAKCSSGTGVRDFMDVRDAGEAMASLALSDVSGTVNVASGSGISVADVARTLGRLAGKPELVQVGALEDRPNEPPRIVADVARLRDEVGYQPGRTLEAGLEEALAYWTRTEGKVID